MVGIAIERLMGIGLVHDLSILLRVAGGDL